MGGGPLSGQALKVKLSDTWAVYSSSRNADVGEGITRNTPLI